MPQITTALVQRLEALFCYAVGNLFPPVEPDFFLVDEDTIL